MHILINSSVPINIIITIKCLLLLTMSARGNFHLPDSFTWRAHFTCLKATIKSFALSHVSLHAVAASCRSNYA